MVDLAGGGEDQAVGPVVAAHIVDQRLARHRRHDLLRPEDGAAHRLVGVAGLLQEVEDEIVGRVLDLADLLEDDVALLLELGRVEGRALQDVGQDVGGELEVAREDAGEVGGVLARGVGVEAAADALDLLGDGARAAGRGALERHVLEQVGDAVDLGGLVAGADVDPDADRRGLEVRHGLADDAQAVVERGEAVEIVGHAGPKVSRMAVATRGEVGRQPAGSAPSRVMRSA